MKRWHVSTALLAPLLVAVAAMLFWWQLYPHALAYQEQYQLFLFSADYWAERWSVAGGVADYVAEFIVQFYRVEWLGALLLAGVFTALMLLMRRLCGDGWLSMVPVVLLLWHMGDESVLLSYAVALSLSLAAAVLASWRRYPLWADVVVVPLLFWCVGALSWVYVLVRCLQRGARALWLLPFLALSQWLAYTFLLRQWSWVSVLAGINYYRVPLQVPVLQWLIPVVAVAIIAFSRIQHRVARLPLLIAKIASVAVLAFLAVGQGYDRDVYELIRQDYLVRTEQWDELIRRAERRQVPTAFSSNCVNLALAERRQLAARMFQFYQSGSDALVMPRLRDLTSNLPSAEAFWRLGMVNSAQRYMFDIQESILNARRSGRCTQRIAECMLVNGHYRAAEKQLALLRQSLFYRSWAKNAERYLYRDDLVDRHPDWGRLRRLRYRTEFLYNYAELDKMLGLLFVNNTDNRMALDYFMAQLLLDGKMQQFIQYMSWVQQYGGYSAMPAGYADAVRCMQNGGAVEGSPYGNYIKKMMKP